MNAVARAIAELQQMYPATPDDGTLGGLVVILGRGGFFWLCEWIWPENPQQRRWRTGSWVDLGYWFLGSLMTRVSVIASAVVAIALLVLRIPHHPSWIGRQPASIQVIEILLIGDFTAYWIHRAMHGVPWLWRLHALHHSSEQLDWLAAARVHPLETFLSIASASAEWCQRWYDGLAIR